MTTFRPCASTASATRISGDIAGIAAFFALSNRMANFISMRPNDEFYAMGREPR